MFDQGEILLIPVPFSDLSSVKKRPVLVLSNYTHNLSNRDNQLPLKRHQIISCQSPLRYPLCIYQPIEYAILPLAPPATNFWLPAAPP